MAQSLIRDKKVVCLQISVPSATAGWALPSSEGVREERPAPHDPEG